jgi:hypothetical protein
MMFAESSETHSQIEEKILFLLATTLTIIMLEIMDNFIQY